MPLTDEQKTQMTALLADADPGDLPGYVPQGTLKARLSDKDTKRQALQADHDAALAALRQEHTEQGAALKKYQDADATAEQIAAREIADHKTEIEAHKAATAAEKQRGDDLYDQAKANWLHREIGKQLRASGVNPANMATATREALAENQLSVLGDKPSDFSIQAMVNGIAADDPLASLGDWYKKRNDLHEAKGTGLPRPGAGLPPGSPPPKDPTEGLSPEQILKKGFAEFGR